MVLLTTLLATAGLLLLAAGLLDLSSRPLARRRALHAAVDAAEDRGTDRLTRLDRSLRRTRPGRWLDRQLVLAGSRRSPSVVALGGLGAAVLLAVLLWQLFAPAFGVLGVLLGLLGVRAWLRRGRERRNEAFVAQMPELARVLANATNAGLSIATAVAIAAEELDDPARGELRQVSTAITFGDDLETALNGVRERLPSREVSVLLSTLLVSARSGGSLVTSLRDIADTLEERKETRREVRSVLAQSVATGYTVIGMGFALLLLLNVINPGTVEQMTRQPLGQAALLFAAVLFTGGFLVIRRMTRTEP